MDVAITQALHELTLKHLELTVKHVEITGKIEAHERVCSERYKGLHDKIGLLSNVIVGSAGTLIVGMGGIIITLLVK